MSALKRRKDNDIQVDTTTQAKTKMIEPLNISAMTASSEGLGQVQSYVIKFESLEKENEILKQLADTRFSELTRLQQSHYEVLKKLENLQYTPKHESENIVMMTSEYKCLENKYTMVVKENLHLKKMLESYQNKCEVLEKSRNEIQISNLGLTVSGSMNVTTQGELADEKSVTQEIQDLKIQLKRATSEQNDLKLLLDMYKHAHKDPRDKIELVEAEKKLQEELSDLKHQMKLVYGRDIEDRYSLQLQNEVDKIKTLENTVFQLKAALTAQKVKEDALVSEMERTGVAFEDMQEQIETLSKQITEKDDAYIKLLTESIQQTGDQSIITGTTDEFKIQVLWAENVALAENGAKLVNSSSQQHALNENLKSFSSHDILKAVQQDCQQGIVVKLSGYFLLNRIKFLLRDKDDRSYSYYIETSLNGKTWTRICDYSMNFCRSWQFIIFPETIMRFIKIVGTHCTMKQKLHVVTIQAYLAKDKFKIDRSFNVFGLIVPKFNVALPNFGAKVIRGKGGDNMINGDSDRHLHNSTYQIDKSQPIVLQLSQPYIIGSMRFLLWDTDDQLYSYDIYVSTNLVDWERIAHSENEQSWQILKFKPIPVAFIWISNTSKAAADNVLRLVHFECPLQL